MARVIKTQKASGGPEPDNFSQAGVFNAVRFPSRRICPVDCSGDLADQSAMSHYQDALRGVPRRDSIESTNAPAAQLLVALALRPTKMRVILTQVRLPMLSKNLADVADRQPIHGAAVQFPQSIEQLDGRAGPLLDSVCSLAGSLQRAGVNGIEGSFAQEPLTDALDLLMPDVGQRQIGPAAHDGIGMQSIAGGVAVADEDQVSCHLFRSNKAPAAELSSGLDPEQGGF